MPSLYREDGAGDSGPMCTRFRQDPDTGQIVSEPGRPTVGWGLKVGSMTARTYSAQDWWACTPIIEIIEDTGKTVKFKTRSGSIYTWSEQ